MSWHGITKGCFEAKLGNLVEALKCLEKAIEADRKFIELANSDEDLAILKNDKRFQILIKRMTNNSRKAENE
jgi:hypothetical protein